MITGHALHQSRTLRDDARPPSRPQQTRRRLFDGVDEKNNSGVSAASTRERWSNQATGGRDDSPPSPTKIVRSRSISAGTLSLSLSSLQQHKARTPRSDKNVVRCSLLPRLRNDLYCVEWDVKLYYTIPYHARCCSLNRRSIQLYVYATVVIDAKSQDQIKSNQNPKPLTLNYQRCTIKMQASKIHS